MDGVEIPCLGNARCNLKVWNQDDTVAVKDGSQDMLFERVTASGVGLTIGSIGSSTVRNITFRDCNMYDTYKVRPCV
jgi:hypothetical protein